jgi:hypothetical protein
MPKVSIYCVTFKALQALSMKIKALCSTTPCISIDRVPRNINTYLPSYTASYLG